MTTAAMTINAPTINTPDYAAAPTPATEVNKLASLPSIAQHGNIEHRFANIFESMGGKVSLCNSIKIRVNDGRYDWHPDIVAEFSDFIVIVEIKSDSCKSSMGFHHPKHKVPTYHNAMKQALLYGATYKTSKPIVCMIASNREFLAFNPKMFNASALLRNKSEDKSPSAYDLKLAKWIKRQIPFKAMKVCEVNKVVNVPEFLTYLRTKVLDPYAA
jgi:hypothetical protein